ncbi:MAG: GNAT family N-acetyltransferase [Marmoricola sp.]
MSDFRIRGLRRTDAPAVTDLLAAAEAVDKTGEHFNLDDLLEDIANPMIDPSRDWLVVEAGERVVAHSRLTPRAPADGALKVYVEGTVHPDFRRRGIGSELVPAIVERAVSHVHERGDLRAVVAGQAQAGNTDLDKIFGSVGLTPDRWSFVMLADLASATDAEPAPPAGYTLSTWEGADHEELRETHNRVFVPHPGFTPWSSEMWAQWVAGSRALRPALSLILRDETGAVAAYVQSDEYDAVQQATGIREAYVAKVGTVPEHGRRGLAGTLLRIAMQRFRDAGFERASLDVDSENPSGALGIYERAGFRTETRWISYRLAEG